MAGVCAPLRALVFGALVLNFRAFAVVAPPCQPFQLHALMPLPSKTQLDEATKKAHQLYGPDLEERLKHLPTQTPALRAALQNNEERSQIPWRREALDLAFWSCAEP